MRKQVEAVLQKNGFIIDMDNDIVAGIELEIDTCLVLSGITSCNTIDHFPYRP